MPPTPPQVLGDATHPETWAKLAASMKERQIPAFDLVTMRPMGGWEKVPSQTLDQNAEMISLLFEQVVPLLSPDGQFYFTFDIPRLTGDLKQHPRLRALVERIESETPYRVDMRTDIGRKDATLRIYGVLLPKTQSR